MLSLIGTIINSAAVLAGGSAGLALKGRMSAKVSQTLMQGIGLFTVAVGIQMALTTKNALVVLFSVVSGAVIGELIDIESWLEKVGKHVEDRLSQTVNGKAGGGAATQEPGGFSRAFVATTILFCVGPMAIMGSIADGLKGDFTILLTKSVMDGLSSIAFASSLGPGVLMTSASLFLYQGILTLLASSVSGVLTNATVTEMTAVGGLLIIGIGINILEITRIRVGNMLPALLTVVGLVPLWSWIDRLF